VLMGASPGQRWCCELGGQGSADGRGAVESMSAGASGAPLE
jgi:hypothetical protein